MIGLQNVTGDRTEMTRNGDKTQVRNGDRRRNDILNAAAQAFMERGYGGTKIDDIAELLGGTKGLIYHHFQNKTELFFEVHFHAMRTNIAAIEPIANGNGTATERLREMVHLHVASIFERLAFQRVSIMGIEMTVSGTTTVRERAMLDELLKLFDAFEALYVQVIRDGVKSGEFVRGDARTLAKPLLGALNWMVMWYRPRPSEGVMAQQQLTREMSDFVLRGLGVAEP